MTFWLINNICKFLTLLNVIVFDFTKYHFISCRIQHINSFECNEYSGNKPKLKNRTKLNTWFCALDIQSKICNNWTASANIHISLSHRDDLTSFRSPRDKLTCSTLAIRLVVGYAFSFLFAGVVGTKLRVKLSIKISWK